MTQEAPLARQYWEERYRQQQTGWDTGAITTPLKTYLDQLPDKHLRVLVPGGGIGHEAEYLHQQGFTQVYLLDIAQAPLQHFQERVPAFPVHHIVQEDFFGLILEPFDLVLEQTFFCALPRSWRNAYARQMYGILKPGGKLVGVLFSEEFTTPGPPFGGTAMEYQAYFEPFFRFLHFEPCYNSIKPRQGKELFMELEKKERPQFIV